MKLSTALVLIAFSPGSYAQSTTVAALERACIRQAVTKVPVHGTVSIAELNTTTTPSRFSADAASFDIAGKIAVRVRSVNFTFAYRCQARLEGDWHRIELVSFERLN